MITRPQTHYQAEVQHFDAFQHSHNINKMMRKGSAQEIEYYNKLCFEAKDFSDYDFLSRYHKNNGLPKPLNKYGFHYKKPKKTDVFVDNQTYMIGTLTSHYKVKINQLKEFYKFECDDFARMIPFISKEYIFSLIKGVHEEYKKDRKAFDYTILYVLIHQFHSISMTRFRNIATAKGDPIRNVEPEIITKTINIIKEAPKWQF